MSQHNTMYARSFLRALEMLSCFLSFHLSVVLSFFRSFCLLFFLSVVLSFFLSVAMYGSDKVLSWLIMKKLCTRNASALTNTELIKRCHKQSVHKKSRCNLQVVRTCTLPTHHLGQHRTCWVGRIHQHATEHLPTVNHGCARGLLKPCSTNSNRSIHIFVTNLCCIKVAINTERGIACKASTRARRPDSASASRLLVSTSSPLSYPMPRRFRHSRYFAVCSAFVSPSAVFVWVGSLTTANFLSSCFA